MSNGLHALWASCDCDYHMNNCLTIKKPLSESSDRQNPGSHPANGAAKTWPPVKPDVHALRGPSKSKPSLEFFRISMIFRIPCVVRNSRISAAAGLWCLWDRIFLVWKFMRVLQKVAQQTGILDDMQHAQLTSRGNKLQTLAPWRQITASSQSTTKRG